MAFSVLLLIPVVAQNAFADVSIFPPSKDSRGNSLVPDQSEGFAVNIGLGTSVGGSMVRSFLAFDLSSIPVSSTITNVELKLSPAVINGVPIPISVHKITTSWDESTASWNTPWTNPGGDFISTASKSDTLTGGGFFVLSSSSGMVNDVQSWVNVPSSNNGWLLKRTTEPAILSQVFFSAKDGPTSNFPMLTVTFTPPPDVVGGELLPIDTTALILAGLQTSAIWMLPVLAGAAGVGAFYIKTRMNKE